MTTNIKPATLINGSKKISQNEENLENLSHLKLEQFIVEEMMDQNVSIPIDTPIYVPPLNFSLVEHLIYRSGFPMPKNYPFLKQLDLKTIIYLGDLGSNSTKKKDKYGSEEIMINYQSWINENTDIKFHKLLFDSPQEPFTNAKKQHQAQESLTIALQLMLDKQNFPMLIHSNKGKHRIGVLVGLMRKILQGWCLSGIFEEYEKFAMGKSEYDLEFIELWQPELWIDDKTKPEFVRI